MSDRVSTQIKCSDCGKTATVNFKPNPNRPVYCRECLTKHRPPRTETGNQTQTKPSSQRPGATTEKNAWSRRRQSWK